MSRRSQSQKKRHTKPCKFFQINRCPHPAEVCDFAHVIVNPPIPFLGGNGIALCRYYYAGLCVNGALCPFQHGNEGTFDTAVNSALEGSGTHHLDATCLETPPLYANYPSFSQSWSHHPISPPFSPIADSVLFSPARCRDSINTSISSSSVESDDSVVVTDDPQYQEHSHSHQSQVYIADDAPVIHVPPFHHPMSYISPTGILSPTHHSFDYYGGDGVNAGGPKVSGPHSSRATGSKPISKAKLIKYKTKPCKFFSTERGCPNGNACTFIHEEVHPRASSPPALKPSSDSETRKNFVPIPWRVIGGGVRVGIQTNDAENNEPSPSFSKGLSLDIGSIPSEKIKPGHITRQRSNSIPSAPSITQFRVDHLFSAESPGVL